jgi:LacI family transcriptional regulator
MYHRIVTLPPALRSVPTVLLDAESADNAAPAVVPDEVHGARLAVGELLEQGHTRIGFLTNIDDVPATTGRLLAYRERLAEAGIDFDPTLVAADVSEAAGGYRTARALLDQANPPSALFCYNDRMAMGAYRAAAELGLRIPSDVSVIGFDNQTLIAENLFPGLSTVALPHYEMGAWAVDTLARLVTGEQPQPDAHPLRMPCPLVRRESVGPPNPSRENPTRARRRKA